MVKDAYAGKSRAELLALLRAQPVKAAAGSPFDPEVAALPKGDKQRAQRALNLAGKVAGKFCDGHGTHAAHGFVFAKTACTQDGQPL